MSTKYQERLSDFLSECKLGALQELGGNEAYKSWKNRYIELAGSLMELMPPECSDVFKQFQEAANAIGGIETDFCYMCGMRDYLSMGQQFDKSTGAWDALVEQMIPAASGC
jgi:hypothetical protein